MALSFYHFYENWMFQKDEVSLEDFVEWFYLKGTNSLNKIRAYNSMDHISKFFKKAVV